MKISSDLAKRIADRMYRKLVNPKEDLPTLIDCLKQDSNMASVVEELCKY